MWISKKKWNLLERRVDDLEGRAQGRRSVSNVMLDAMMLKKAYAQHEKDQTESSKGNQ